MQIAPFYLVLNCAWDKTAARYVFGYGRGRYVSRLDTTARWQQDGPSHNGGQAHSQGQSQPNTG